MIFLSLGVDDRKLKFMKTDFDVANKSLHWKHRLQTLNTVVATNVPGKTVTLIYNKIWAQQSPGHFSNIGLSLPTTHSSNPDCMVIKIKRSKRKENCTSWGCAKHLFFYWSPIMQFDLCQNQWMAVRVGYKYMVHYYCITHILHCLYMVATFYVANPLSSIELQYNNYLQFFF